MQVEKQQHINNVSVLPINTKNTKSKLDVDKCWPLVHFLIAEALKYSGQYADAHHIKEFLVKGEMNLFIMFGSDDGETNKVFGCCVTRFFNNPNYKELQGLICTGSKMHLWEKDLVDILETFAKINECKRIKALMRPGYKKVMKKYGWNIKHYEFQKELN